MVFYDNVFKCYKGGATSQTTKTAESDTVITPRSAYARLWHSRLHLTGIQAVALTLYSCTFSIQIQTHTNTERVIKRNMIKTVKVSVY